MDSSGIIGWMSVGIVIGSFISTAVYLLLSRRDATFDEEVDAEVEFAFDGPLFTDEEIEEIARRLDARLTPALEAAIQRRRDHLGVA